MQMPNQTKPETPQKHDRLEPIRDACEIGVRHTTKFQPHTQQLMSTSLPSKDIAHLGYIYLRNKGNLKLLI